MDNVILVKHPKNWGLDYLDFRSQISNLNKIQEMAQKVLEERGYDKDTEVSIVFVGRKSAKQTNIKYRNKDYIPQVLGFPMSKERDVDGYFRLGDIMICTQKLKYEAVFQKQSIDEVLMEWLRHGVDNLLK